VAALLAAGVSASMAQSNVYSLNIAGYINSSYSVPITAGKSSLIANQLNAGGSTNRNRADAVFGIPANNPYDGDAISLWVPGVVGHFDKFLFDIGSTPTGMDDGNGNPLADFVNLPTLVPGVAFFYQQSGSFPAITNITFVGEILTPNSTNFYTNHFAASPAVTMRASVLPLAGAISSGPPGMPYREGDALSFWGYVGAVGKYTKYIMDTGAIPTLWTDGDGNPIAEPAVTVGQGFFIDVSGDVTGLPAFDWIQKLTNP
jgi:hypothetical protein